MPNAIHGARTQNPLPAVPGVSLSGPVRHGEASAALTVNRQSDASELLFGVARTIDLDNLSPLMAFSHSARATEQGETI